jgi:hypothetical protein
MTTLTDQQKQLIFDFCIGVASEDDPAQAEQLIASNEQAAQFHEKIQASLAPLEAVETELCPDRLVEGTMWRITNQSHPSHERLEQLLASERARDPIPKRYVLGRLGRIVATAAAVLIIAGIWVGPMSYARQKYWQMRCESQLGRVFLGLKNYMADHDNRMPAVATAEGSPWWKIGYPGQENHSNTRHWWLLVKGGYAEPADFVCPGCRRGKVIRMDPVPMAIGAASNDFPDREHITYSLRIRCQKSYGAGQTTRKVLIADLSPFFENLPRDYSKPLKIQIDQSLLFLNSINHNRHGQNVMFCDGSIEFVKTRKIGISLDDIFTLREMRAGSEIRGYELPSCETDAFLAP